MKDNSRPPPLFERLKSGMEEALLFTRGEASLRTTVLPSPPPAMRARDVVDLRRSLGLTQRTFARMLNVSIKSVQSWEQGSRQPSQAALRLLQLLRKRPTALADLG
jgi:putative transcriptional regulator